MKSKILGFAGRAGSGKSTISTAVANRLGWKWASFGQFLRDEASRSGFDPSSREILQTLGQKFIDEGWKPFCSKLLQSAHWVPGQNLVIDGIRHRQVVETIKDLTAPSDVAIVFVNTADRIRESRLLARQPSEDVGTVDRHPLERHVSAILPQYADYTIDGSIPPEECAARVIAWLVSRSY